MGNTNTLLSCQSHLVVIIHCFTLLNFINCTFHLDQFKVFPKLFNFFLSFCFPLASRISCSDWIAFSSMSSKLIGHCGLTSHKPLTLNGELSLQSLHSTRARAHPKTSSSLPWAEPRWALLPPLVENDMNMIIDQAWQLENLFTPHWTIAKQKMEWLKKMVASTKMRRMNKYCHFN